MGQTFVGEIAKMVEGTKKLKAWLHAGLRAWDSHIHRVQDLSKVRFAIKFPGNRQGRPTA